MTFAAVGGITNIGASPSLSPASIGDLMLMEIQAVSTTVFVTGVSGGNCTWSQLGSTFIGAALSSNWWLGQVTGTGSAALTLTFNGATPGFRGIAQEFSSTVGPPWTLDTSATLDANANAWPSMTPAGAGELYFAYGHESGNTVNGSTPGYTYGADSANNGYCYNPACTGAAQQPTFGNTDTRTGIAILVRENLPSLITGDDDVPWHRRSRM